MKWTPINLGTQRTLTTKDLAKKQEQMFIISILVLTFLSFFVTPHMLIASFAYMCLFSGMVLRRHKNLHPKLMMTGILTDVVLVLILEIQRSAIKTAVSFSLTLPQQLHIAFSLLAILYYIPVFYLGMKRVNGTATLKQQRLHVRLGVMALAFRTLGFILMFSFLYRTRG